MPVEGYPATSSSTKPVTEQDQKMSVEHKKDALRYNEDHARAHEKVASGIRASLGDSHGDEYPEYGFYGPSSPFSTVSDEGEVQNGHALGHMEQDGKYFRSNNPTVLGYDGFEETDQAAEKFGQTGEE